MLVVYKQKFELKIVEDLGVSVTPLFNFKVFFKQICNKTGTKISWMLPVSVFKSRFAFVLLTLFKSQVRSIIEYC